MIAGYDQGPMKARLATFVRKVLKRLFSLDLLIGISWSGRVKGKNKVEGVDCRNMIALRSYPGMVTLMKGELYSFYPFDQCNRTCNLTCTRCLWSAR